MLLRYMDLYLVSTQFSIVVTTHIFLLHVCMVDTYMIIIMSFTSTVAVHIFIIDVVRTFVHSYMSLLLVTVFLWVP